MSLGSQLVFSYLEKYLAVIIAAAASMVISRYLGPEDVGVFSVCMAMVGLIAVIREFRTDLYVLRLPEPDKASVRAVFTFVAGAGLMLGLGIMLIADPLSRFYDDPRIASILAILGLSFMITPLGSVSQSLLQRGQRFDVLAKVRVAHAVTAGGVSVVLAIQGFGPESMAYGILAAAALNAILSYAALPHSLLPALPWRDFRAIIRSGWPQTATALVDEVAVASPDLVLGRLDNLRDAGLLSRASGLVNMVHQLAVRGADPVLLAEYVAREKARREAEPLFIVSTSYLVGIGGACLCLLAVQAEPVVRILFGAGWMEIVPAVRWLCLGTSISLLSASAYQFMLARGLAQAAFQCKLVWVPVHLAILLTTASQGIYWMAVGLALSSLVHSILMARALQAQLGVSIRAQLEVVRGSASLVAIVGAGGMAAVLLPAATVPQSFLALCAGTTGAAAGFLLWMRMSGNPLAARLAGHLVALRGR